MQRFVILSGTSIGISYAWYHWGRHEDVTDTVAHCLSTDFRPQQPGPTRAVKLAEYRAWLLKHGVDLSKVNLVYGEKVDGHEPLVATVNKKGKKEFGSGGIGFGRLRRAFRSDPVLASFPIENAIQVKSLFEAETQSTVLRKVAERDPGGSFVMTVHLMVENMKGESSYINTWLKMLKKRFAPPICWTVDELEWLRGTTLYIATEMKKKSLEHAWNELKPLCIELAKREGLHQSPTYQDFLWAHSAFWSLSLPLPSGISSNTDEFDFDFMLMPGSELFEIQSGGHCRWDVRSLRNSRVFSDPEETDNENNTSKVRLCAVCSRKKNLCQDDAITIQPGDDMSNEQIIFQYGSRKIDPRYEVLMINCPLPPVQDWDQNIRNKFSLLKHKGLSPQLFLSKKHLEGLQSFKGGKFFHRKKARDRDEQVKQLFPQGIFETLEIFTMDSRDVERELKKMNENNENDSDRGTEKRSAIASSGARMAVLTTMTRLLELKVDALESYNKGTGPLEIDLEVLAAIENERESITAMPHSGPTPNQMTALLHRIEQKRLARAYLELFSKALQEEMNFLHQLKNEGY